MYIGLTIGEHYTHYPHPHILSVSTQQSAIKPQLVKVQTLSICYLIVIMSFYRCSKLSFRNIFPER